MNHAELSENFAAGSTKGKSSNMFIEGDTIYSYGYHFPIAKRLSNGSYMFNSDSYSSSTATQIAHVRNALSYDTLISISKCDIANIDKQIDADKAQIADIADKLKRARSDNMIISHKSDIIQLQQNIEALETLRA